MYKNWWGDLKEKRQFGRPKRRWEDNIKMGVLEMGCGGGAWNESSWLRIETGDGHL